MSDIRELVRLLVKEHLQSTYNDYRAAMDPTMRRLHVVSEEDVKIQFPDFVNQVHGLMSEEETPELIKDVQWFLLGTEYMKNMPIAILPTGDDQVVYWDPVIQGLKTTDDFDFLDSLRAFADRKPGAETSGLM